MSSDIIKLQMQIEEGQKEFEERLKQQTEEAYNRGKQEGFEEARSQMQEQIETLKKQYLSSIEKLDNLLNEYNQFFEKEKERISEVAFEIAKEIIAKELTTESKKIAYSLAKNLIDDIKDATKIIIKTNPKDFEYIKEKFAEHNNIEISKDEAVSEGGVVLMSDKGNIDGDIKTRIEKARELIMEKTI